MIQIEKLSKRYGESTVVDDVSMVIEPRTMTMIVGTSGSGKSTLLRMINRLVEPTSGRVLDRRQRHDCGASAPAAPPHRLRHPGPRPVPASHRRRQHRDRAATARLERRPRQRSASPNCSNCSSSTRASTPRKFPHELSGGQQQRVGVARALAAKPNVLLMDEPFGALDPIIRTKAQDDLLEIQRRFGTTIILVTHDMDEAFRLGDRVAVMSQGRLLQYDRPGRAAHAARGPLRLAADRLGRPVAQAAVADDGGRSRRTRDRGRPAPCRGR